jgi:TonB-dependent receptor
MRIISMFFVLLILSVQALAGGKISGKVTDEKTGDPIIGATVMVQGTGLGTATDVDGRFILDVANGDYVVEIKYIGYQQKNVSDVVVKEGQVTELNAVIAEDDKKTLKEVVVTASLKKESINALYMMQKNSISVSSGISADVIQRTPDKNTGEVLKRVSGASIKDGKYVVIRGLSDRYNMAMVNNALMPSTEPDKKAFSFDVIPSNLIDNIIINKTASADLPGDFAGGVVTVLTKDIPERDFFNIGLSGGYNTQSTFKDYIHNERGSTDYLGFPGKRNELPASFGEDRTAYNTMKATNPEAAYSAVKDLPNDYKEVKGTAMPNLAVQLSGGVSKHMKNGDKFGTVLGLSFRNTQTIIPEFIRGKYEESRVHTYSVEQQNRFSSNLAGLANFSYVTGKTKIGFKNLFNKMYDNTYYQREGYTTSNNQQFKTYSSVPSERQVYNAQLEGDHAIGKRNIKAYWNLSYSNLQASQKDLRTAFYARAATFDDKDEPIADESLPYEIVDRNSRRFFSKQKDNSYGGNFNINVPFAMWGQKHSVKFGYLGQYKDRDFSARVFQYEPVSVLSSAIAHQPVNTIFDPSNVGISGGFGLNEITSNEDAYKASGLLNAGFVMLDNSIAEKFRLTWGVRVESYTQNLKATLRSGTQLDKEDVFTDVLPSFNLSYNMTEKTKFRLSASRTVNRPEFREIAPFQFIDFENVWTLKGDTNLVRGNITNIDLRYEYYPSAGEAITAGVFYKNFSNPIEAKLDDQSNLDLLIFTYQNAKSAYVAGLEFEVRKNLSFIGDAEWLKNLVLGGNVSYIYSRVDAANIIGSSNTIGTKAERPLQGQSPYLINLSALYNAPKAGLAFSAMYNRIGHRIYAVGNAGIPTTWENGRDIIDLQISKQVLKNRGEVKLTVGDLLNQPTTFYWNTDTKDAYKAGDSKLGNGNDRIFQQYKLGTTFTLGFNYRLSK